MRHKSSFPWDFSFKNSFALSALAKQDYSWQAIRTRAQQVAQAVLMRLRQAAERLAELAWPPVWQVQQGQQASLRALPRPQLGW